jgi:hypothetical protein
MECPEISELAAFAETRQASSQLTQHVQRCDACQEALVSLEEEVLSLQIPLSEIWFRYHVSCPKAETLLAFAQKKLDADAADYVQFHVDELECSFCQGRLGDLEIQATREGQKRVAGSRKKVGEATTSLLRDMGKKA